MKIAELTAFHVRLTLRKPVRHASYTRSATDNLIVRCVLEDGTEGFGEGVPREYVTGETLDSALDLLQRSDLAAQLGEPCRDFAQAVTVAERFQPAAVPGDDRGCQGNAARCAVELAFLDAFGRHFGQPLSAVTGLLAPELAERHDWVRYSGVITSARGWKMRLAAWRMRVYRFPHVKIKVGIAGYDDVLRLKVVRGRVLSKVELRVDTNEAWSPAEAAERILALEPYCISAVEQPVAHAQVQALTDIRRQVHTPIMLDESLTSRVDAERTVADGTCDLFNLRLSKCGGFIPTLRLAEFARQHGLGYQLGCQVGESALLSAAGRHFASSVAGIRFLEGSYDRHLVREALGKADITFGWGGWAPALAGPGLGVQIDPEALNRLTVRKEPLLG
ncbi:MAG TPA: dipeptide epimerase [Gemmataceae bacterium]|nr:dipeptide epimerase [Gemmataceae bacterium]